MKKKKLTPRQKRHSDIFDFFMEWGMLEKRMPKFVLEALDIVADYAGDVAMGRRR